MEQMEQSHANAIVHKRIARGTHKTSYTKGQSRASKAMQHTSATHMHKCVSGGLQYR